MWTVDKTTTFLIVNGEGIVVVVRNGVGDDGMRYNLSDDMTTAYQYVSGMESEHLITDEFTPWFSLDPRS